MRLDKVYIDGFKNLQEVTVDFDEQRLTTVLIGQNGTGKSNLLEAITDVFRFLDLNRAQPRFRYAIDYRIGKRTIQIANLSGTPEIRTDGSKLTRQAFDANRGDYFPDLVFGYYSGGSRRLERLFDSHQRRYYDAIKLNDDEAECRAALVERRLFYCRPIHGVFALLAFFAFPDERIAALLRDSLGVTAFHSALALFRKPWFANTPKRGPHRGPELWGAKGPAGRCARALRDAAFYPLALEDKAIDDYRDKGGSEQQYAAYLKDLSALRKFAEGYADDREIFTALEAVDISDLFRELHVWVMRVNDTSGDVSFADLSDGERQLLMVLGLIRVSRGRRALFLLDEPDTHLNPAWQHIYLDLLRDWAGAASDIRDCHIVLTSHNPVTIAGLEKADVRVMFTDESGRIAVREPYADPRGMGFTATLTEIFGLRTSLDAETQRVLDERNLLTTIDRRTQEQERQLIALNDKLNRLGFMFEDREPLYQNFLRALRDIRYADKPPLTPDEIARRQSAMRDLIGRLVKPEGEVP